MTKAFNEFIIKQHVLCELADPTTNTSTVDDTVPVEELEWVKGVNQILEKCYHISNGVLEGQYFKSTGRMAQKNVHLTFYPVQDLIRLLNANKLINPNGALANAPLTWSEFVQNVENNKEEPAVKTILTQWKAQLINGDYEGYVIKDPALAKEYDNKKKDKETASLAALSTYNNDTVYDALVKIVERRISPLQKFDGEIAKRLGNVTQYEAVLRSILNNPADVAASIKKLPGDFFKYCDIQPRALISLSLACAEFYKVECARIATLAIERKAKERIPFADQVGTGDENQPVLGTPVSNRAKAARSQPRERGAFAAAQRELDLSSLQAYDSVLDFVSFEKFSKGKDVLTEADMWQNISTYIKRYGKKGIQGIWAGVKFALTRTKKLPSTLTEYENFLRTGIIKTSFIVKNNELTPGATPVFDVELQIDSSKERINGKAIVYTVGFITNLANMPNSKEAQALMESLRNLAEYIDTREGNDIGRGIRALAGVLK